MNRWIVAAIAGLGLLAIGVVGLVLVSAAAIPRVEHRGTTVFVYGRGSDIDIGYLPAGRYVVTVLDDHGRAERLSLIGADGTQRFSLDFYAINQNHFGTTAEIPGQDYRIHTDVNFAANDLGPRATPTTVTDCTWIYQLTPTHAGTFGPNRELGFVCSRPEGEGLGHPPHFQSRPSLGCREKDRRLRVR